LEDGTSWDLSDYLPDFLWVLRDFHLRLQDASGRPITSKEYLEKALEPASGQEKQNKLREVVRGLFPERDCMTIARPCTEEEDLRHVNEIPYDSLRPQFRSDVEEFTRKVYKSLRWTGQQ